MFDNAMAILEAQDVVWILGVILVGLATIVQKASKKYKPWSWLAEQFGKAVNKEMLDKLDVVSKKVEDLEAADKKRTPSARSRWLWKRGVGYFGQLMK